MKKKYKLICILSVIVGLIVGAVIVCHGVYRFAHPVPLNILNVTSMPPEVQSRFDAEAWNYPAASTSVFAYCSRSLRSSAYLRFRVPDVDTFNKFKTNILSSATFTQTSVPNISKRDLDHIKAWWNISPAAIFHKCSLWFFGFDEANSLVYVLWEAD